jgi:hypothetical protein
MSEKTKIQPPNCKSVASPVKFHVASMESTVSCNAEIITMQSARNTPECATRLKSVLRDFVISGLTARCDRPDECHIAQDGANQKLQCIAGQCICKPEYVADLSTLRCSGTNQIPLLSPCAL